MVNVWELARPLLHLPPKLPRKCQPAQAEKEHIMEDPRNSSPGLISSSSAPDSLSSIGSSLPPDPEQSPSCRSETPLEPPRPPFRLRMCSIDLGRARSADAVTDATAAAAATAAAILAATAAAVAAANTASAAAAAEAVAAAVAVRPAVEAGGGASAVARAAADGVEDLGGGGAGCRADGAVCV